MSSEGSPSLLNLREFRKQKKSPLSHKDSTMNGFNSSTTSATNSDDTNEVIFNFDMHTETEHEVISTSSATTVENNQKTTTENVVSNPNKTLTVSQIYTPRLPKSPSVLEREKQMKFLLESFPSVDAMEVHNLLSKHNFDTDSAVSELSLKVKMQQDIRLSYAEWQRKEKEKENNLATNTIIHVNTSNPITNSSNNHLTNKRKAAEEVPRKKKVKRRTESFDSDDSDRSGADFKDTRVFDSDQDSDVEISNDLTGDKRKVMEFFETATLNELQLMNYCSKKKAELLIEARPFKSWIDLVEKLQSNKNLSTDLLNSAQQVLVTRNNIKQLMKKCTNIALQMERAVAAGAGVKTQPNNLNPTLKLTSYQMVGLNWLSVIHAQGVNGILADEMGLGKTVQVIAFLAHLKETGAARSTHLIVVPASTLDNWKAEFSRWCPELRVFMYYGSMEERRSFRFDLAKGMLADFDVILTTYNLVANTPEERKMFRVTPMHYVVFDEAHMLKNMNTQRYENLIRINAKHRILLTGTPLQNNLLELMSLLIFVMPKMFGEKANDLKNLFQKNSKAGKPDDNEGMPSFEREQIEQAKRIMKPFVLRRLKCDVLQDLPKKIDHIINVPLAPTQQEQYADLIKSFQDASTDSNSTPYNGITMMTELRKLSNHPLLMRLHYDMNQVKQMAALLAKDPNYKDTKVDYIVDDLIWMSDFEIHNLAVEFRCLKKFQLPDNLITTSGKFLYLDKLLSELKTKGHRVLIFSQYVIMLNVMEEYMRIRNHSFLRLDGSTAVNTRQQLIDRFNEDRSIFLFLLSTKAGGLGINLTAADTVIIHDIDFNPYNDKQAEDRCHRMGQLKPVSVYRLISQGTIEEGMLQMNKEKLKLERDITTEESDNPDVKSVVRLLSTALGIDPNKATNLVSPKKI